MLDFGYDDGGAKTANEDILLVSVQVGRSRRLRRFARRWKRLLADAGVNFWHSKHYSNFQKDGVFGNRDREQRRKLLVRLVRLIHDFMDFGITIRLDAAMYEQHITPAFRNEWATPFCFAVQLALIYASLLLKERSRHLQPVNVLIEDGHKNVGQAIETLKSAMSNPDSFLLLKSCGVGPKAGNPILQAADMLAYSEWQYLSRGSREIFDALNVNARPYRTYLFDCEPQTIDDIRRRAEDPSIVAELKRRKRMSA